MTNAALNKLPGGLDGEAAAYARDVGSAVCLVVGEVVGLVFAVAKLIALLGTPILIGLARQPKWWIVTEICLCLAAVAVHWLWKWVRRVYRRVAVRWRKVTARWRQVKLKYRSYKQKLDDRWFKLKRLYKKFLTQVGQKSRLAAALFPHALFFILMITLRRAAPLRIHYALSSSKLTATVLIIRGLSTDTILRRFSAEERKGDTLSITHNLPPSEHEARSEDRDEVPSSDSNQFLTPVSNRSGSQHNTATKSAPPSSASRALVALRGALHQDAEEAVLHEIRYWIIFAVERFFASAIFALPYGHAAAEKFGFDSFIDEARGLLLIWLQLPLGSTAIAFNAVHMLAHLALPSSRTVKSTKSTVLSRLAQNTRALRSATSRILSFVPLVSAPLERYATIGLQLLADTDAWILLLVGTFAFFTVGPIARFGALAVAFLLPALAALRLCLEQDQEQKSTKRLSRSNDSIDSIPSKSKSDRRAQAYLTYFLALAFVDLLLLDRGTRRFLKLFPFRAHISILFHLWLQLPYFNGAILLHSSLHARLRAFADKLKDT